MTVSIHLKSPYVKWTSGLNLGKIKQKRSIAQAYEKVGESSTSGVRKGLINSGYAEASKIFTVLDIDGKEVVWNGRPGTTDKELSGFKNSPTKFMDDNAPSEGYYVFIGAYDDDFHSFAIVLDKSSSGNIYTFIDQFRTQELSAEQAEEFFLKRIDGFSGGRKYPLMLELYQLRNNNKHEN